MRNKGKVFLVGAGPGSPDLITLKGIKCLRQAEVVIYDRLANPRLLDYVPQGSEIIYAGKSPEKHTLKQDEINRLLVKKARQGKIAVRLKSGDPFLFGRGAEEALFLAKHKIPFEVVPGVSSAIAVPAYAGIPLTHRDYTSSVGIFTGHEDSTKRATKIHWEKIAGLETLVFLMGVENLSQITKNLLAKGKPKRTPCCLIQAGTYPGQKTITADLITISEKAKALGLRAPAILVVGEVVSLRKKLNWYEQKPLFGKKILITRQAEGKNRLLELLESYGASCAELPVIEIKPLENYDELDRVIKRIDDFHWLVFTSQNGVKFFQQRLVHLKKDARILGGIKIAVIGPRTKQALENIGLRADLEPSQYSQEGLLGCFKKIKIKGKAILIVRAQEARDVLPLGLRESGAKVTVAPAYQAIVTQDARRRTQDFKDIDVVTFTSSSCAQNFFQIFSKNVFQKSNKKPLIASIGPATSGKLCRLGLRADIEAKSYTFEGLAEGIVQYYQK